MPRHAAFSAAIFGGRTGVGIRDARLEERVQMNEEDIVEWTGAIGKEE
jgi:hypothetical protein